MNSLPDGYKAPLAGPPLAEILTGLIRKDNLQQAIFLGRDCVQNSPHNLEILFLTGLAYEKYAKWCNGAGDFAEAAAMLETAKEFFDRTVGQGGKTRAARLNTHLNYIDALHGYSEDEPKLLAAAQANPSDCQAYISYIENLFLQSKFSTALASLEKRIGGADTGKAIDVLTAFAGSYVMKNSEVDAASQEHARSLAQSAINRLLPSYRNDARAGMFLACLKNCGLNISCPVGEYPNASDDYMAARQAINLAQQTLRPAMPSIAMAFDGCALDF